MMKKYFSLLILISTFSFAFESPILIDKHFSPNAASHDFLFIENQLLSFENRLNRVLFSPKKDSFDSQSTESQKIDLDLTPPYQLSFVPRVLMRLFRLTELNLFWGPLNSIMAVTQHEVFGHGYRVRDLGEQVAQVSKYEIMLPYPFGKGGGGTDVKTHPQYSVTDDILISIAGCEAETLLSHYTTLSWLSKRRIDGREASLYFPSSNSLAMYILTLDKPHEIYQEYQEDTGHDVINYLFDLNNLYPSSLTLNDQIVSLRKKAALSAISDFFNYYTIAAYFKYIWTGNALSIPFFKRGPIHFMMPIYRVALSPFGPENVFGAYLSTRQKSPTYLYFKQGSFSKNRTWGFGIENQGFFQSNSHLLGFKMDIWRQPKLLLYRPGEHNVQIESHFSNSSQDMDLTFNHEKNGYSNHELFEKKIGMACSIIYQYQFEKKQSNTLYTQLGFKTKGYLPGESIRLAPILRFGMTLFF